MNVFHDMAVDVGHRGDESRHVARTIEEREADEQHTEDLAAEHAERLDWIAGQVVSRLHGAGDLRDLVVQVLHLGEQAARDWPPAEPVMPPSDDEIPF